MVIAFLFEIIFNGIIIFHYYNFSKKDRDNINLNSGEVFVSCFFIQPLLIEIKSKECINNNMNTYEDSKNDSQYYDTNENCQNDNNINNIISKKPFQKKKGFYPVNVV